MRLDDWILCLGATLVFAALFAYGVWWIDMMAEQLAGRLQI